MGHDEPTDALKIASVDPSRKAAVVAVVVEVTGLSQDEAEILLDTHELIECADESEASMKKAALERLGATVSYTMPLEDRSATMPNSHPESAMRVDPCDLSSRCRP